MSRLKKKLILKQCLTRTCLHNVPERDVAPWLERSLMVRWVVWIDPSWGGPIELFPVPASAPRLV